MASRSLISTPPTPGSGRRGELRLAVTGRRWRTRCRAPLFVNVLPTPGGVLAIPVDQGGGLRTGERHLQRIRLDREAEATWAPPATTLCLPGSGSGPAYLQLVASVRGGSYLRVVGRPLIPFRGAAVIQSSVVSIVRDSACLLLECGCPGRTQMGEAWAFRYLGYHLTVVRDGSVIYRERYRLHPPAVPHGPSGFGGSLGWASCVAVGARAVTELDALRPAFTGAGVVSTHGLIADDVAVARVMDRDGTLISALADLTTDALRNG